MKTFYSAVFMFILAAFAAAPAHSDVLYATSSTVNPSLLVVNPFDGVVHSSIPITNAQALLGGLCFDGVGFTTTDGFNNALQDRTFRINATTGAGTVVGNTGYSAALRSCDWHLVNDTIYQLADNSKLDF